MGGRGHLKVKSDGSWSGMGGYMEAKIQKLEVQFQDKSCSNEQLSSIFNNVAIHVNGYTNPSCDELKTLMAKHGGKYHAYYSRSKTITLYKKEYDVDPQVVTSSKNKNFRNFGNFISNNSSVEHFALTITREALEHYKADWVKTTKLRKNNLVSKGNYTTHVIASNLPRAKSKDLKPNEKVVRPEWIVDSIDAGKLLPIQAYLLVGSTTGSVMQRTLTNLGHTSEKQLSPSQHQGVLPKENQRTSNNISIFETSKNITQSSHNIAATTDSDFLKEFYANSRLHFISIWKNEMADFVRALSQSSSLTGREQLIQMASELMVPYSLLPKSKVVIHIDMDCFFVSVGLLSRPHLKGRPVAVTHHSNAPASHKQRLDIGNTLSSYSEIASCNYEARAAGLKNGIFYGKAKELCPDLVAIPYDFDAYKDVSNKLYTVLSSYTHTLEAVSCDEALLDITQLVQECKLPPDTIAQHIRAKVQETTGCNASAGIGPNILLARMATRRGKPNGQHEVKLEEAEEFIRGNQLKDLPGVGHSTVFRLKELGVLTCYDLQQVSPQVLKNDFGNKTGQRLHELARGIDNTEVCQSKERKSVSADVNYGIRLTTHEELRIFLTNLAKEVTCRLKKINLSCKKVTLKVMVRHCDAPVEAAKFKGHGVCNSMSRSKNLDDYTDDFNIIMKETMALMLLLQLNICDLRGIGIQLSNLVSSANILKSRTSIKQFLTTKERKARETNTAVSGLNLQTQNVRVKSTLEITETKTIVNDDSICFKEISAENEDMNESFLHALPEDLRKEVENNYKSQQESLRQVKKLKPSSALNSFSKNLFHSTSSRTLLGKGGQQARSKSNRKLVKRSPTKEKLLKTNGSPNKLITDMFSVIPKSECGGCHESVSRCVKEPVKTPKIAKAKMVEIQPSTSLGGVTNTHEIRNMICRWTDEFAECNPLPNDVKDVVRYLSSLIVNIRDLESVYLILRTVRRCIQAVINRNTDANVQKSWLEAYQTILSKANREVAKLHNGAHLQLPKLHVL